MSVTMNIGRRTFAALLVVSLSTACAEPTLEEGGAGAPRLVQSCGGARPTAGLALPRALEKLEEEQREAEQGPLIVENCRGERTTTNLPLRDALAELHFSEVPDPPPRAGRPASRSLGFIGDEPLGRFDAPRAPVYYAPAW